MSTDSRGLSPQAGTRVEVLLASPLEQDHTALRGILRRSNWKLLEAFSCTEALEMLRNRPIRVIICERDVPDGGWKTLLDGIEDLPERPRLIVCSRLPDHQLWAEVLNLDGYDVLPTPFEAHEVFRVVFLAWHSSRNEVQRKAAGKSAKPSGYVDAGAASRAACTAD